MSRPETHRSLSQALRAVRSREEQETLLGDEENADQVNEDYCGPPPNPHGHLPVYRNIHRIRRLVLASIDDPYTLDQLRGPQMNRAIVRPLVERLYDPSDLSTVYCLLVNRVQFLRDQSYQAHHQTVNITRACLCELVASRILRRFDEDFEGRPGLLLLGNVLVSGFEPFQNAPSEVINESSHALHWALQGHMGYERRLTALEIAIISEGKNFLSSSACQKIVEAIYLGRIVYTPTSFIDILPDHYKYKAIALYDPRKAPILNQYRLIVPRTRNIIEVIQFIILLVLFMLTMTHRNHLLVTGYEVVFCVYAAGWVLDEFASMLEHGWKVHTQNLWSFLDISFVAIYLAYFIVRLHGWTVGSVDEARQALDLLSIAAPILLTRLAFNFMPENMLFISLRAMMGDFVVLTLLAVWCFAGFLLALKWLNNGRLFDEPGPSPDPITIGKWMLWIWFGLDGTGIQRSTDFHFVLGPVMMVTFAFLGNTLFLTILVSMLSNTFSKIVADATAEIQFRRAVLTFEGVKSDAIFAYRPPFNILALIMLLPLKFCVSPRWFHKVNVTAVRVLNAPILLFIGLHERRNLWKASRSNLKFQATKRSKSLWNTWGWNRFSVHGDIQAVFDAEPPQELLDEIEEEDELNDDMFANGGLFNGNARGQSPPGSPGAAARRRRRWSSVCQ